MDALYSEGKSMGGEWSECGRTGMCGVKRIGSGTTGEEISCKMSDRDRVVDDSLWLWQMTVRLSCSICGSVCSGGIVCIILFLSTLSISLAWTSLWTDFCLLGVCVGLWGILKLSRLALENGRNDEAVNLREPSTNNPLSIHLDDFHKSLRVTGLGAGGGQRLRDLRLEGGEEGADKVMCEGEGEKFETRVGRDHVVEDKHYERRRSSRDSSGAVYDKVEALELEGQEESTVNGGMIHAASGPVETLVGMTPASGGCECQSDYSCIGVTHGNKYTEGIVISYHTQLKEELCSEQQQKGELCSEQQQKGVLCSEQQQKGELRNEQQQNEEWCFDQQQKDVWWNTQHPATREEIVTVVNSSPKVGLLPLSGALCKADWRYAPTIPPVSHPCLWPLAWCSQQPYGLEETRVLEGGLAVDKGVRNSDDDGNDDMTNDGWRDNGEGMEMFDLEGFTLSLGFLNSEEVEGPDEVSCGNVRFCLLQDKGDGGEKSTVEPLLSTGAVGKDDELNTVQEEPRSTVEELRLTNAECKDGQISSNLSRVVDEQMTGVGSDPLVESIAVSSWFPSVRRAAAVIDCDGARRSCWCNNCSALSSRVSEVAVSRISGSVFESRFAPHCADNGGVVDLPFVQGERRHYRQKAKLSERLHYHQGTTQCLAAAQCASTAAATRLALGVLQPYADWSSQTLRLFLYQGWIRPGYRPSGYARAASARLLITAASSSSYRHSRNSSAISNTTATTTVDTTAGTGSSTCSSSAGGNLPLVSAVVVSVLVKPTHGTANQSRETKSRSPLHDQVAEDTQIERNHRGGKIYPPIDVRENEHQVELHHGESMLDTPKSPAVLSCSYDSVAPNGRTATAREGHCSNSNTAYADRTQVNMCCTTPHSVLSLSVPVRAVSLIESYSVSALFSTDRMSHPSEVATATSSATILQDLSVSHTEPLFSVSFITPTCPSDHRRATSTSAVRHNNYACYPYYSTSVSMASQCLPSRSSWDFSASSMSHISSSQTIVSLPQPASPSPTPVSGCSSTCRQCHIRPVHTVPGSATVVHPITTTEFHHSRPASTSTSLTTSRPNIPQSNNIINNRSRIAPPTAQLISGLPSNSSPPSADQLKLPVLFSDSLGVIGQPAAPADSVSARQVSRASLGQPSPRNMLLSGYCGPVANTGKRTQACRANIQQTTNTRTPTCRSHGANNTSTGTAQTGRWDGKKWMQRTAVGAKTTAGRTTMGCVEQTGGGAVVAGSSSGSGCRNSSMMGGGLIELCLNVLKQFFETQGLPEASRDYECSAERVKCERLRDCGHRPDSVGRGANQGLLDALQQATRLELHVGLLNSLLDGCLRVSLAWAVGLFRSMQQDPRHRIDVVSYNTMIKGYTMYGRLGDAEAILLSIHPPSPRLCGSEGLCLRLKSGHINLDSGFSDSVMKCRCVVTNSQSLGCSIRNCCGEQQRGVAEGSSYHRLQSESTTSSDQPIQESVDHRAGCTDICNPVNAGSCTTLQCPCCVRQTKSRPLREPLTDTTAYPSNANRKCSLSSSQPITHQSAMRRISPGFPTPLEAGFATLGAERDLQRDSVGDEMWWTLNKNSGVLRQQEKSRGGMSEGCDVGGVLCQMGGMAGDGVYDGRMSSHVSQSTDDSGFPQCVANGVGIAKRLDATDTGDCQSLARPSHTPIIDVGYAALALTSAAWHSRPLAVDRAGSSVDKHVSSCSTVGPSVTACAAITDTSVNVRASPPITAGPAVIASKPDGLTGGSPAEPCPIILHHHTRTSSASTIMPPAPALPASSGILLSPSQQSATMPAHTEGVSCIAVTQLSNGTPVSPTRACVTTATGCWKPASPTLGSPTAGKRCSMCDEYHTDREIRSNNMTTLHLKHLGTQNGDSPCAPVEHQKEEFDRFTHNDVVHSGLTHQCRKVTESKTATRADCCRECNQKGPTEKTSRSDWGGTGRTNGRWGKSHHGRCRYSSNVPKNYVGSASGSCVGGTYFRGYVTTSDDIHVGRNAPSSSTSAGVSSSAPAATSNYRNVNGLVKMQQGRESAVRTMERFPQDGVDNVITDIDKVTPTVLYQQCTQPGHTVNPQAVPPRKPTQQVVVGRQQGGGATGLVIPSDCVKDTHTHVCSRMKHTTPHCVSGSAVHSHTQGGNCSVHVPRNRAAPASRQRIQSRSRDRDTFSPPTHETNVDMFAPICTSGSVTPLVADEVSYNSMINGAVESGNIEQAWTWLHRMTTQASLKMDRYTCSIMTKWLHPACHPRDIQRALILIDSVDVCQDSVLLSTVVDACSRLRDTARLQLLLEKARARGPELRLNVHAYGTLIKACGRCGKLEEAWRLWAELSSRKDVEPSAYAYGCMLDTLVSHDCLEQAEDIFTHLIWSDVEANTVHYSILIKGCVQRRDRSKVMAYYNHMRTHGVPCNLVTYNTLIQSCTSVGDMHGAQRIFDDMSHAAQPSFPPVSSRSFSTCPPPQLLKPHYQSSNPSVPIRLYDPHALDAPEGRQQAQGGSIKPLQQEQHGISQLQYIHQVGTRECTQYSESSTCALYRGCDQNSDWSPPYDATATSSPRATETPGEQKPWSHHGMARCFPDLISYSTMIKGYCKQMQVGKARELFDRMKRQGIRADAIVYNTLLEGTCKMLDADEAETLVGEMRARSIRPSCFTLAILIRLYGRLQRIEFVLKLMREFPKECGWEPDSFVYSAVVLACATNGRPDLGIHFFVQMKRRFPSADMANSKLRTRLILSCLDNGLVESARRLFEEAVSTGCYIDDATSRRIHKRFLLLAPMAPGRTGDGWSRLGSHNQGTITSRNC
eukprot:GHVQ01021950.1.p1 GENE.GHVQ01021950.1~~GHVQ01021950.1.p1  ORF type:complete len:2780 (+),score=391.57 GHVQ01021950.1:728-9067(+)